MEKSVYNRKRPYVRLPLENAGNVRDLGGYPGAGGRATRFRRFLRAGTLAYLQDWEIDFLLDYGVRTVIDLRTEGEAAREPNPMAARKGVKCHSLPFLTGELSQYAYEPENASALSDMYIHILSSNADMIAEAMRRIASAGRGAVLYNCSAGKDRTGVLSYMLLALAGVPREDIIANYQSTEVYYLPLFKKYAPDFDRIPLNYLRSQAENMERTIDFLEGEYAGAEEYLLQSGVSAAEIERIRRRLLD